MGETTATAASAVAQIFEMVSSGLTTMSANPLVMAAFAIPLTGSIIVLVRKLFKRV